MSISCPRRRIDRNLGPSGFRQVDVVDGAVGIRPAHSGTVIFNGKNLYETFDDHKASIGFVPQDDIVPTALKVERVLQYAAELRLSDLPVDERRTRVDDIINRLGLAERRKLRVGKLSGGQRKRVNVGVELLSEPDILFADEPTSGLDPALEAALTDTLRKLADDGSAVVVTTHVMTSLAAYDFLCVIVKGHLAYFGPPAEIKPYFEVEDYAEIYTKISQNSPAEWRSRFQKSKHAL